MKKLCYFVTIYIVIFYASLNAQWIQTNGPYGGSVTCFAVSGTNLFAGTYGGVFLSTNNGTNWTAVNTGLTSTFVSSLAVSGTNLFVGTFGGVFLSTNNGTSWTAVNTGLTDTLINVLVVLGTNLFAGTVGSGVFLSTNNGTSWTAVNTGLTSSNVSAFAVSGTNLFTGTGGSGGVFLSTNNGTSWTATGLTNTAIADFSVSGTNLFAGTYGSGVFLSTNNGTSWTDVNTGLTNTNVFALAVYGTNLFAGTDSDRVWGRPLSEMITGVEDKSNEIPFQFVLEQNYPNPFNPNTAIQYTISSRQYVQFKVYDVLGNEVATLVNEEKPAGVYEVKFDASQLSSGIYLYKLLAGSFVETKKMILMK